MTDRVEAWGGRVRSVIQEFAGGEAVAAVSEGWRGLTRNPNPVVTLFGAYDGGKSSLLKRLLVEDGKEYPNGSP